MTADELEKMQADSRKRHRAIFGMGVIMPVEEPCKRVEEVKEKPKKVRKKEFFPDLMAAQISVTSPSIKKEEEVMKDKKWLSLDNPYVPKPVQKKLIFHSPGITPDPIKPKEERPPATYSNSPSPYGIYDELKEEWNKKTG